MRKIAIGLKQSHLRLMIASGRCTRHLSPAKRLGRKFMEQASEQHP